MTASSTAVGRGRLAALATIAAAWSAVLTGPRIALAVAAAVMATAPLSIRRLERHSATSAPQIP